MLLSFLSQFSGAILVVMIIVIALAVIVGLAEAFASISNWIVYIKFRRMRKIEISNGHSVSESVRIFLDANGMSDVKVEQAGFWNGLFFGNHYSIKKNTFFIRKRQMDTKRLVNVTDSVQRAAKAMNYRNGTKGEKRLIRFQNWIPLLPYLVIPIVLIGVIVDAIIFKFNNNALVTLIFLVAALIYFIFTAIIMFMTIRVEKKANEKALELMGNSNFLTSEETEKVNSIFKWRIISYIANFIIALIRIIQLLLKIIALLLRRKK